MLQKLQVGKPYPEKLEIKDGMAIQAMPSGLMALVHLSSFQSGDKKALGGPVGIAVLQVEDALPWVALRFHKNGLCFDGPVLAEHQSQLMKNLEAAGNGLQLVITKGGHHTVRGLRLLGLNDEVYKAIKTATNQKEMNRADLTRAVRRVQSKYPTSDRVYEEAGLSQDFR